MSDIPSSQPVTDELGWVVDFNDRVRRLRAIIDSARPHVSELVTKVVTASLDVGNLILLLSILSFLGLGAQ